MRYLEDVLPHVDQSLSRALPDNNPVLGLNRLNSEKIADQPKKSLEMEIADAVERGRQESKSELENHFETQLSEFKNLEREKHEVAIRELEATTVTQFSDRLAAALVELEQNLDAQLSNLVAPFIKKLLPQLAADELLSLVKGVLSENINYRLHVSGPQSQLSVITEKLNSPKIEILTEIRDGFDMCIRNDEFLLTTRIQEWVNRIDGRLDA